MSFSLYIGALVYGGFGGGSMEASVAIPVAPSESGYCDFVDRKAFLNNCDGCGGSNPHDWDVQFVFVNRLVDEGMFITWEDDVYVVRDSDDNEIGSCSWNEPGSSDSCTQGTDNYNMANYMDCDLDVDLEW